MPLTKFIIMEDYIMKKTLAMLLAGALALSLLAGCGGDNPDDSASGNPGSSEPGSSEPVTDGKNYQGIPISDEEITLKAWESTAGADTFIIEAGKKFTEMFPNITVTYENVELGDAQGQIALDGPTGNGPDVFAAPNNTAAVLVNSGLILPTAAQDYAKSMLTDGSITAMTYNGELYGVPIASEGYALFYNRTLISDDEVPKSYEDLVAFCQKFNAENPGKYGFLMNVKEGYYSITNCTQTPDKRIFGEFGDDPTVTNLNNEACADTFSWMVENLRPVMNIPSADIDQSVFQSQFIAGNAAMFVTGLWDVSLLQEQNIDFGVTTLPTLPGTSTIPEVFSTARMIYTSAFSEHPNEANAFALFLISDEMQQLRYEICGSCPTTNVEIDSPFMGGFAEQMAHSYPCPVITKMDAFWDAMNNASANIWDSKLKGDELKAFVQNELNTADATILAAG